MFCEDYLKSLSKQLLSFESIINCIFGFQREDMVFVFERKFSYPFMIISCCMLSTINNVYETHNRNEIAD